MLFYQTILIFTIWNTACHCAKFVTLFVLGSFRYMYMYMNMYMY